MHARRDERMKRGIVGASVSVSSALIASASTKCSHCCEGGCRGVGVCALVLVQARCSS
jgi:hypothetical protein